MVKGWQDRILDWLLKNAGWLIIALTVGSLLGIWWIPIRETSKFTEQNEARRTMVQICGGVFAVFGFLLALVRLRHTAKDLAIKESADLTGRYMRAAELLGSIRDGGDGSKLPNLETRLGAIYSLERLAYDSRRDYEKIMRVLSRYVRANAEPPAVEPGSSPADNASAHGGDLRCDLQTAIEVLVQRYPHQGIDRHVVDVRKAYLDGLELAKPADLRRADLSLAALRNAAFTDSDLRGANLFGAILESATFDRAELQGSDLSSANLINARLQKARFDNQTRFTYADLSGAQFYDERGTLEQARGLAPAQILEGRNWERAKFSQAFGNRLRNFQHSSAQHPAEFGLDAAKQATEGSD